MDGNLRGESGHMPVEAYLMHPNDNWMNKYGKQNQTIFVYSLKYSDSVW